MNSIKTTVLHPLEDRVLIDPDPAPEKMGGLELAESHKKSHQPPSGTVIAVGPGKADKPSLKLIGWRHNDEFFDAEDKPHELATPVYTTTYMPVKVGDRVMFGAYANMEVQDPVSKQKFLCMRREDLFVAIEQ